MARQLVTPPQINRYVTKLIGEANHHAPNVVSSIQPLAIIVINALKQNNTNTLFVYERNGQLARTCWLTTINGRFCFSYNYNTGDIELRERSTQGRVLFSINDSNITNQQVAIAGAF